MRSGSSGGGGKNRELRVEVLHLRVIPFLGRHDAPRGSKRPKAQ